MAYSSHISSDNVTVLSSKYGPTSSGSIQGLLYVPAIQPNDPCGQVSKEFVPAQAVRKSDLPPTNYNLVALAPWIDLGCTKSFLSAARRDPLRAFIFYKPDNDTSSPPDADSDDWDLGDGGDWKTINHFPVMAVSGLVGQDLMYQLSLYSGNLSQVPNGNNISVVYNPDPNDYVRIWTRIDLSTSSNLPSIWFFFLIIACVLIAVIGSTSLLMHLIQSRRRKSLRQRVRDGQVNLEGMGIKRTTVPLDHVQSFPLFTYNYEPDPKSPPSSPASPQKPCPKPSTVAQGKRARPDSIVTTALPISEKGLESPFAFSTTATDYQPTCAICLDPYQSLVTVIRELPCGHIFHPECIDEFLTEISSLCPVCKACILPKGYSPKITNIMVRRERAIRRLRDRIEVEDLDSDSSGTKMQAWASNIKRKLTPGSHPPRPGPHRPPPPPSSSELQPRRRTRAHQTTTSSGDARQRGPNDTESRDELARRRMRELAGSDLDEEESRLNRCTFL